MPSLQFRLKILVCGWLLYLETRSIWGR